MIEGSEGTSRASAVMCSLPAACAALLAEIDAESNSPAWNEKLFASEFDNAHSLVLGARLAGQLVAFLVVHIVQEEAHIVNFGVRKAFRGAGIGRALLEHALEEIHINGGVWITLEVRRSNEIAQRLYESVGFLEVGERQRFYSDNGEDALLMRLDVREFTVRQNFARRI